MISKEAIIAKEELLGFIESFDLMFAQSLAEHQNYINGKFSEDGIFSYSVAKDIALRKSKRFRAFLAKQFYELYGGTDSNLGIELGFVIELIQVYLLIADDFADKSNFRRHGLTAHKMFQEYIQKIGYSDHELEHVANSLAVFLSLIVSHTSQLFLSNMQIDPQIKNRIFNSIHRELLITGYGQLSDMFNQLKPHVTEQDVINMLSWKTGAYTFENPVYSGMYLSGVTDDELIKKMAGYAINGEIAFQIQDDILGMFGVEKETGKSNMDDLKEGKYTLLIQYALENGTKSQVDFIKQVLGNAQVTQKQYESVKEILVSTGSLEYSKNSAIKYANLALAALEELKQPDWNSKSYKNIVGITKYIVERDN